MAQQPKIKFMGPPKRESFLPDMEQLREALSHESLVNHDERQTVFPDSMLKEGDNKSKQKYSKAS